VHDSAVEVETFAEQPDEDEKVEKDSHLFYTVLIGLGALALVILVAVSACLIRRKYY